MFLISCYHIMVNKDDENNRRKSPGLFH